MLSRALNSIISWSNTSKNNVSGTSFQQPPWITDWVAKWLCQRRVFRTIFMVVCTFVGETSYHASFLALGRVVGVVGERAKVDAHAAPSMIPLMESKSKRKGDMSTDGRHKEN